MVAMELTVVEESEVKIETKMTTMNMQIETGVMILMISSPKDSRTLLGLGIWAIGCERI